MPYQIDFDQVAQAGRASRHRPTFPAVQFEQATDPRLRQCEFVLRHQRFHHNAWYLPLYDAYVRTWLKKQLFTVPVVVSVSGLEVECSKEVPDMSEEIAEWIAHYSMPQFSQAYLLQQQEELGPDGGRQFSYGKEHERAPRLAAIKHVLSLLVNQT